jgi:hypothetical protein
MSPFLVSILQLADIMLIFCSFPVCGGVCTLAGFGPTLQGDTPLALRCLQGLTDDRDDQKSDYFGQTLVDLAGLLMPDALGNPKVELIQADDVTLIRRVREPTRRRTNA